jgi:hypothetical protein
MWLRKEIQEVLRTSLSTVTAAFTGCLLENRGNPLLAVAPQKDGAAARCAPCTVALDPAIAAGETLGLHPLEAVLELG